MNKKQISKKRNIFGWCQWSTSSTAVIRLLSFVQVLKKYVQICKKKELKVYYFIAKNIKEVDEICKAQLYIASKMAFAGTTPRLLRQNVSAKSIRCTRS